MFRRPKKPAGAFGLGVAILVLGLIALPLGLADPTSTTRVGIPVLLGSIVLLIWGLYLAALGGFWMRHDKRSS